MSSVASPPFSLSKFSPLRTPDVRKKSMKSPDVDSDSSFVTRDIRREAHAIRDKMSTHSSSNDEGSDVSRDLFLTQSSHKRATADKTKRGAALSDSFSSKESSSESEEDSTKPKHYSKTKSKTVKKNSESHSMSESDSDSSLSDASPKAGNSGLAPGKPSTSAADCDSESTLLTDDSDSEPDTTAGKQKQNVTSTASKQKQNATPSDASTSSSDDEEKQKHSVSEKKNKVTKEKQSDGSSSDVSSVVSVIEFTPKPKQKGQRDTSSSDDSSVGPETESTPKPKKQRDTSSSDSSSVVSDSETESTPKQKRQRDASSSDSSSVVSDSETESTLKEKRQRDASSRSSDSLETSSKKIKHSSEVKKRQEFVISDSEDDFISTKNANTSRKESHKTLARRTTVKDVNMAHKESAISHARADVSVAVNKAAKQIPQTSPQKTLTNGGVPNKTLRYNMPEDFEEMTLAQDFVSLADTEGKEPWLIRVPIGMDVQGLHGQRIKLDGVQSIHLGDEAEKQFDVLSMPTDQETNLSSFVSADSHGNNMVMGPRIAGQIHVMHWYPNLPPVTLNRPPAITHTVPDNLKQTVHMFGRDSPERCLKDDDDDGGSRKKTKKKKKHRESEGRTEGDESYRKRKKDDLSTESIDMSTESIDVSKSKKKKKKSKKD